MTHPSNRSERRYAREVARNRRRTHIFIHRWYNEVPQENRGWNKGGKQYFACGNRCMSIEHHEEYKELKALRRDTSYLADLVADL
jgi:hypothetical protein